MESGAIPTFSLDGALALSHEATRQRSGVIFRPTPKHAQKKKPFASGAGTREGPGWRGKPQPQSRVCRLERELQYDFRRFRIRNEPLDGFLGSFGDQADFAVDGFRSLLHPSSFRLHPAASPPSVPSPVVVLDSTARVRSSTRNRDEFDSRSALLRRDSCPFSQVRPILDFRPWGWAPFSWFAWRPSSRAG